MTGRIRAGKSIDIKNAEVYRTDVKNPRATVVLVQGWNCRAGELEGLAKVLDDNQYSTRRFENPGVGKTILDGTSATDYFNHTARIVAEICIADGIERPILVTHSMGGYTANAFLNWVRETRAETRLPRAMYEITPAKVNPVLTLPDDKLVFKLSGWATRMLIENARRNAARMDSEPTEANIRSSAIAQKILLHAFDILGPTMIRMIGGSREAAREFGNFTQEALEFDVRLSALQALAMCDYSPNIRGSTIPAHVRHVYGEHDIFISPEKSIPIAMDMYGDKNSRFSFGMLSTGHFPHRENLKLLSSDMLEFLERA